MELIFNTDETAKCKAAKEVIKFLTAQLKEMAERLPVGASYNVKSPSFASFGSNRLDDDVIHASVDQLPIQSASEDLESTATNGQLLSNGSSSASTRSSVHNKQGHPDGSRNGSRVKEAESRNENEWLEPGLYVTFTFLSGGAKDLKRVRFSRKRFSEKQAEQWWAENRARVYEQCNVRLIDKAGSGVGSDDLGH